MKKSMFIPMIALFILVGCDNNHSNSSNYSNSNTSENVISFPGSKVVDDEGFEYNMFHTRAPLRNGDPAPSLGSSSNSSPYEDGYEDGYEEGYRKGSRQRN